ncbi:zinc finger protein ZAT12-like protein [Carex littledalei]|uniref:Zinc finger protein ZAT12-like protein n=1 Tax=Carex littledalei TaxID=544730 RepID=A0A833QIC2_9POAL|nr:zinc finger protein ZAT12-like protein [Carex littledalei]
MTSHLRPKVRFDGLGMVITTKFKERKRHLCNLCGKEFMLGQALGGHKRLHRTPAVVTEQLLHDRRREASIDLNMPPLEMNT